MKYFTYIFLLILLSCKDEKDNLNVKDITKIVYISDKITYDITGNFYVIDERYKEPGRHSLLMSRHDLYLVKKKIIDEKIYQLKNSIKLLKSCKKAGCLSEIIIQYKSGNKQHFIFDNLHYKSDFNDKTYDKIVSIEELIGEIIINNIDEPEPISVDF